MELSVPPPCLFADSPFSSLSRLQQLKNTRINLSKPTLIFSSNQKSSLLSTTIHHHPIGNRTFAPLSKDPPRIIAQAAENGSLTSSSEMGICRVGEVKRVTKETNVLVKVNLDGNGVAENSTGIPFLDHMLDQLASHGLFDLHVKATGDYHIDDHHTNEDVALALGTALLQALGDRKGINRFGNFSAPLDEACIHVVLV